MISRSQLLHHRGLYVLQKFSKAGRPHGFRYSDTIYNSVPEKVGDPGRSSPPAGATGTKKDFDFKLFYDALKEHMRGGRIIKTTMDQRSYYSKCTAKEARFLYDQRPRKIAPWGKAKAFKKASAKLSQILEESDNQLQELEVDPDRVIKENALKTQEQEGFRALRETVEECRQSARH